ncbi:MAG TPA: hypothetical protein VG294_15955 [Solirubrobacteraceae bacterium]|jgi:hypothetical protein|nr:hypothetical protein [Solirubrobacteraceae bacterium]
MIAPRAALIGVVFAVAGCGSSGGTVTAPYIAPAKTFTLANFQPAGPVVAHRPTAISFTVQQPSGKPLTRYRTGPGPHTGVHLILVRDDLAYIIHQHPPVGPNGQFRQTVTFPAPGPYKVLVDLYPNIPGGQPNFQLSQTINVAGAYHRQPLPPFKPDVSIDGYHVDMHGRPALHAIQAQFVHVAVTDAHGRKVTFVPWFGALAHAIFFHQGSLDYFHTHICAPNAPNCGSLPGVSATRVTGRSTAPGKLTVGVLLPVPGTWRLFLQMKLGGRIVTAPYTLHVGS